MELREGSGKELLEYGIKEGSYNWTDNSAYASHKGDQERIKSPDRAEREIMLITDMIESKSPSCQAGEEGADGQGNDLLPKGVHSRSLCCFLVLPYSHHS